MSKKMSARHELLAEVMEKAQDSKRVAEVSLLWDGEIIRKTKEVVQIEDLQEIVKDLWDKT